MRKPLLLLGTLAYAIMTIMAVILFEERIAFLDGAFILFSILSEGDLAIQVHRFGSAITQVIPLLASWMGFSLESIMKLYSACFPIYFYSLFLICLLILKKEWYAILLLSFNIGIVTHTFYWVIPEFQQGLSLMIVYFAFFAPALEQSWGKKIWYHVANLGLIVTLAFFHPLMIFPFAFFMAYLFFFSNNGLSFDWKNLRKWMSKDSPIAKQWLLALSSILFISCFLVKNLFFKTLYDYTAREGLKNFYHFFPDYFSVQSNLNFLSYLVTDYYLLILALITICVHAVIKKKFVWLSFIVLPFLGYLLLINISYPEGPHQFYIESLYLPLSLILFLPIVHSIFQKLSSKTILLLLSIIVSARLVHIYQTHSFYSERVAYIRDFIQKTESLPNKKLVLKPDQVNGKKLLLDWGLAYECWLLSTIDNDLSSSVVVEQEPGDHQSLLKENKTFCPTWGIYPYEKLPTKYFIFKDDSYYVHTKEDFNFK